MIHSCYFVWCATEKDRKSARDRSVAITNYQLCKLHCSLTIANLCFTLTQLKPTHTLHRFFFLVSLEYSNEGLKSNKNRIYEMKECVFFVSISHYCIVGAAFYVLCLLCRYRSVQNFFCCSIPCIFQFNSCFWVRNSWGKEKCQNSIYNIYFLNWMPSSSHYRYHLDH